MTGPKDWLVLLNAPGIGTARANDLLTRFENPTAVLDAPREALRTAGLADASIDALRKPDERAVDAGLAWLEAPDHRLIAREDDDYPPQLQGIAGAPVALFVAGDPGALWLPQLAIVGSRSATRGGLGTARAFARTLAGAGLTITSGMALGIDGVAHEAALDAGRPTIAVAAHGLDQVYPTRHAGLAARIRAQGAVVSEYAPGMGPLRGRFPARNRIIAGLSTGVLVIEASVKSGSLITARYATEQNREVFAIPGSIHNPVARGCHRLIKDGAKLVETAEDILQELGQSILAQVDDSRKRLIDTPERDPADRPDPEYGQLLDRMGFDPVSIDDLVRDTGLTVDVLSSMLLILELDGRVESGPGGKYCRIGEDHR
ncbi:MAG: DNA-processing protein DprA [Pseudomonadota bacterium]